jgi:hypothetical protein
VTANLRFVGNFCIVFVWLCCWVTARRLCNYYYFCFFWWRSWNLLTSLLIHSELWILKNHKKLANRREICHKAYISRGDYEYFTLANYLNI